MNNVGKSHAFPTDFVDTTEEEVDNILTINIDATLKVTRAVLPGMVQRFVRSISYTMASGTDHLLPGNVDWF